MRLRWKFFLVLLAFSLAPMVVLTGFNRNHVEKLGRAIANEGRAVMEDVVKNELRQTAEDFSLIIRRSKSALDFSLAMAAAEAERILYAPPLAQAPAAADASRPGLYLPTGARPNVDRIGRLAALAPTITLLREELGDIVLFAAVALEDGTYVTFPGRSSLPADYDPRQRPWYQAAKAAFNPRKPGSPGVIWNDPAVDAATGKLTLTLSRPLIAPGGTFAGVASLDVPLDRMLQEQEIASQWSEAMRAFLVAPVHDPKTGKASLYVWARQSGDDHGRDWKSAVNFESLTSSDTTAFAALLASLEHSRSGVADLPYGDEPSFWAFARLLQDASLVIIVPKSMLTPLADQTGREILAATNQIVRLSGGAMAVVLLAVALAAFFSTRTFIRPLMTMIDAWKRLGSGDFTVRLDERLGDERQSLIDAFNETVPVLADHVRLQRSMELAQEVQQNLLPAAPPEIPGLDVAGVSLSCDETGGDYFDYRAVFRDGSISLDTAVGDVTGHGVPSALLMATARALLLATEDSETPSGRVRRANRLLCRDVADSGRFMTLLALEIRPDAGEACYVRAGHDPALLYDPGRDAFQEWPGAGLPLGIEPEYAYAEYVMPFATPGLVLVLGTDGIWEARNAAGEMYGKVRFREAIRRAAGLSAAGVVAAVLADLAAFRGDRRSEDDVTLVVVIKT
ncbi:SpoIIE family protein phosphatase [Desulfovibrio sp. TomC]|uniref:SpoIIE family protein phosphatase n=1 Tax=Desulfovibrio sp. TomC TaxID=1562888 RepID=UPI000575D192|nr:SpoIIE family protein phosphatase [Desulfovibrio sp. TomC]KHK02936.1 Serine phosphatase RsbU, regulator of sigma subunit [Desulfovibrio sp. TomC]